MHVDIMNFVNKGIYKGLLSCVDESKQQGRMDELFQDTHQEMFGSRLLFIPSSATLEETYRKTNSEEAAVVISLISFLEKAIG